MAIELLAPSGNIESFLSAVESGADAVYLGLKDFSARAKAKNFSYKQLEEICAYGKEKNVKIFVTVNTLIKNSEIKDVVKNLEQISIARADGIIVQDLGVVNIAQKYFPDINLHASTQLAIHNTYGAKQAERMGFKRAVLARELSFEEIKSIKNSTNIELEVFCHGALCFCVSGMCLFSSFIGGYSGNRGHCTQPCRRLWTVENKNGYFLSPKDFQLIDYIKQLQKIDVASLKIEGRLKSPDYVAKTVSAYRLLIDSDENNYEENLKRTKDILALDYARQKTTFNFLTKNENIFEPQKSKNTGFYLGIVENKTAESFLLRTQYTLNIGDTIRIVDNKKDKNAVLKIENFEKVPDGYLMDYNNLYIENGFEVYKIADKTAMYNVQCTIYNKKQESRHCEEQTKSATWQSSVVKPFNCLTIQLFNKQINLPNLFIRINNLKWLSLLKNQQKKSAVVIKLNKNNINNIKSLNNPKDFYFELPVYIDEEDLSLFQQTVDFLISKNCKNFFINNISHFSFFNKPFTSSAFHPFTLFAGQSLYTLNSYSAELLSKYGITAFTTSWEDDLSNIKDLAKDLKNNLIVYLSGFPEIVISKMKFVKEIKNKNIKSGIDEFKVISNENENFIIPKFPINLFGFKNKILSFGIKSFGIDLSHIYPNQNYLMQILKAFNNNAYINSVNKFNFERKLK